MFEHIEIAESIYKRIVEKPSKTPTDWVDPNRAGHSRKKRGESASYNENTEKGSRDGK